MPGSTTRGYLYPLTSDNVNPPSDLQALASGIDTDVGTIVANYLTPVVDSSIGSAATGFTNTSSIATTLMNGKLIHLDLTLAVTSTITGAATGNITPDVLAFTLDAAYRPTTDQTAFISNGVGEGEAVVTASTGAINLRSFHGGTSGITIDTTVPLRIHTVYVNP